MKAKRGADGKFLKRRKNAANPAAAPKRRRKANPSAAAPKRRRRRNPGAAAIGKTHLMGYGLALVAGVALGAVSGGLDKMLDPRLVANGWTRGAIDLGAGVVLAGLAAMTGMPQLATAAAAAGGTAGALRMIEEIGDQQARIDRCNAVIARAQTKLLESGEAGKGSAGGNVPRRRALPGVSGLRALGAASAPANYANENQAQRVRVL